MKKLKLTEDLLKPGNAYCIRRGDNAVLSCPNLYDDDRNFHPYFLYDEEECTEYNIKSLMDTQYYFIEWFYKNTRQEEIRQKIKLFLANFINSLNANYDYNPDWEDIIGGKKYYKSTIDSILIDLNLNISQELVKVKKENSPEESVDICINLAEELNNLTNNEFLRVRVGAAYDPEGKSNDIYFRVSSYGYNWFDTIWTLVFRNKSVLEHITIEEDRQSGKGESLYKIAGKTIAHMPIEEFLTLPGNPVIENLIDLDKTNQLTEEFIDENKTVYTTVSPYEVKNIVTNSNKIYRIFFDATYNNNEGRYYLCSAYSPHTHWDMLKVATQHYYYPENFIKEDDNFLAWFNDDCGFLIYTPKNAEDYDTYWPAELGDDGYNYCLVYEDGSSVLLRTSGVFYERTAELLKILGKWDVLQYYDYDEGEIVEEKWNGYDFEPIKNQKRKSFDWEDKDYFEDGRYDEFDKDSIVIYFFPENFEAEINRKLGDWNKWLSHKMEYVGKDPESNIAIKGRYGDIGYFANYEFDYILHPDYILHAEDVDINNLKKESLTEELNYIRQATPYMLRNDGELFTCNSIHPYIKYNNKKEKDEDALHFTICEEFGYSMLEWFYNHTQYQSTKDLISTLINSIIKIYDKDTKLYECALNLKDKLNIKDSNTVSQDFELFALFNQINNDTNNEFCRVRTSNLLYGGNSNEIYFRISSVGFNWFDIIWNVVNKYSNNISDVTICKDSNTFGGRFSPYIIDNKKIEHLPTEEFLTLSGNPVIEKLNISTERNKSTYEALSKGKALFESYWDLHPIYANNFYNSLVKEALDYDIKNVLRPTKKHLNESNVKEATKQILLEKTRQELINKSKNAQSYAKNNQARGKNRYERRKYSQVANSVRDYNNINMDVFWKDDILEFEIKVKGETNDYVVTVTFDGILDRLRQEVKANHNKLEFKCVLRALLSAFNSGNVYVSCTCPDFSFGGFNYYSAKQNFNAKPIMGKAMQAPNINNPFDTKGAGCKHILLCLSNTDWMMKVASVINNYIKYCKNNLQIIYADYIFPKVYGVPYKQAVQMDLFIDFDENDSPLIPSDIKTLDTVIGQGFRGKDDKGKFVKGNEFRFQKKEKPVETNNEEPLFHQDEEQETNTERRYRIEDEEEV